MGSSGEELLYGATIGDFGFFGMSDCNFNCRFHSSLQVQYCDVVAITEYANSITAEVEVGVGQGSCERVRE